MVTRGLAQIGLYVQKKLRRFVYDGADVMIL